MWLPPSAGQLCKLPNVRARNVQVGISGIWSCYCAPSSYPYACIFASTFLDYIKKIAFVIEVSKVQIVPIFQSKVLCISTGMLDELYA